MTIRFIVATQILPFDEPIDHENPFSATDWMNFVHLKNESAEKIKIVSQLPPRLIAPWAQPYAPSPYPWPFPNQRLSG
jgi:hypothetical protein